MGRIISVKNTTYSSLFQVGSSPHLLDGKSTPRRR